MIISTILDKQIS